MLNFVEITRLWQNKLHAQNCYSRFALVHGALSIFAASTTISAFTKTVPYFGFLHSTSQQRRF